MATNNIMFRVADNALTTPQLRNSTTPNELSESMRPAHGSHPRLNSVRSSGAESVYSPRYGPRSLVDAVRLHAGDVRRVPGDPERLAPPAHTPDVADQRDLGHRGRRLAPHRRRARVGSDDHPRDRRGGGVDDQHRVGL